MGDLVSLCLLDSVVKVERILIGLALLNLALLVLELLFVTVKGIGR